MKCIAYITVLAILVGCRSGGEKPAVQGKNGRLADFVFREEFHNFGSLQAGEIVSYGFCIRNTGTAGLKIENAETDCGCISVDYPEETIAPGDSAFVDILFNSAGETGKVFKEIVLTTNVPNKKKAKLGIAAEVENELIKMHSSLMKENAGRIERENGYRQGPRHER
jgi:hypothetical protein